MTGEAKMIKILFGEIKTGRLKRFAFLAYSLILQLIVFGTFLAIVVAIGAGEHLIGGDLRQAQEILREWFSAPFFFIFGLFMTLIGFAGLNLTVKRIRDTGLPGWWVLVAIFIVEIIVAIFMTQKTSANLHILLTIILLFIPSNTFIKKDADF